MIGLIQKVKWANVLVNERLISEIDLGILGLIGIEKTDTENNAERLISKILNYRIFPDQLGKMNLNMQDVKGGLLLVPQFTLAADTNTGTRASFSSAMNPQESETLFSYLVKIAKEKYSNVAQGEFGAYMQVSLCNDGPVTFILKA